MEHYGVPFSAHRGRPHLPAPVRRHDHQSLARDRPRSARAAAADRTGHAMLHTLYGQSLRYSAEFYHRVLRYRPHHGCGRSAHAAASSLSASRMARCTASARKKTILATGGYGRAYFSCTSAHTCTGDGNAMVLRAGLPLQDMEFVQFHPTGIYGAGVSHHRRLARRGRLPRRTPTASASWSAMRRHVKDLASRDVVSRVDDRSRSAKGAASARTRTTSSCISTISIRRSVLHERLPGITESAKVFAGVDLHREPIPVRADCPLQHGWHPDELSRRGADAEGGQSRSCRAGPHGHRRSSLRFGARRQSPRLELADRSRRVRSCGGACKAAETSSKWAAKQPDLPRGAADLALSPPRPLSATPRVAHRPRSCAPRCRR
jgi:succinate dehydrogenase/fumarate reductase flavoprotein subunit